MTRRTLVVLASYAVALSLLTVAVVAMADAEPEATPEPILAPASLVVAEAAAPVTAVSTTQDESEEVQHDADSLAPAGASDAEVGAGRSSAALTSGPAPSATPHQLTVEATLTEAEVYGLALDVSGSAEWARQATAVSWCESRWRTDVVGAAGERGMYQVLPRYHGRVPTDALGQTVQAYALWQQAGWSPWSCGVTR